MRTAAAGTAEELAERDRLWQAQKMELLGRLAGGVAHDFNNLLVVIRGYAELIGRDCTGENAERIQEIVQTTDHGAALTRQLLMFSRDGAIAPAPLDLNELVDDTAQMLRRLLDASVELAWDPSGKPALTMAEPTQLQQVLINLVVNASDAMPAGGTVHLATRHVESDLGRRVLLTVADTGTGIDAVTLERIFDPFFTTKSVGTGLGLSTVYGIVRRHDGFVSVESQPGQGTTFGVNLPAI
jgi:signal transduction histidine kinase